MQHIGLKETGAEPGWGHVLDPHFKKKNYMFWVKNKEAIYIFVVTMDK